MSRFVQIDRDTAYLLPPSVQEWLPEDHLARFIVETVEQLDLSELERQYAGRGMAAFPPSMLLALLFYGYATGEFSSRRIERATYDSVAFRFIAANTHPDHDTIAAFRKRFLGQLKGLFVQILQVARALNLLKVGNVSLDGTKVKANASRHRALSYGHAGRIRRSWPPRSSSCCAWPSRPTGATCPTAWMCRPSCPARGAPGGDPPGPGTDRGARGRAAAAEQQAYRSEGWPPARRASRRRAGSSAAGPEAAHRRGARVRPDQSDR